MQKLHFNLGSTKVYAYQYRDYGPAGVAAYMHDPEGQSKLRTRSYNSLLELIGAAVTVEGITRAGAVRFLS